MNILDEKISKGCLRKYSHLWTGWDCWFTRIGDESTGNPMAFSTEESLIIWLPKKESKVLLPLLGHDR